MGVAENLGPTVARAIAVKELADVVIIDIAETKSAGIALDLLEACPIDGSDARLVGYGATDEGWKAIISEAQTDGSSEALGIQATGETRVEADDAAERKLRRLLQDQ